jgi:hypothetical protein
MNNEAEWEEDIVCSGVRIVCSNCHEWGYTKWDIKTPYCPYCGKKMKNGIKYFDEER